MNKGILLSLFAVYPFTLFPFSPRSFLLCLYTMAGDFSARPKSLRAEGSGWCTEGFDPKDLREAKVRLEELSDRAIESLGD